MKLKITSLTCHTIKGNHKVKQNKGIFKIIFAYLSHLRILSGKLLYYYSSMQRTKLYCLKASVQRDIGLSTIVVKYE